MFDACPDESELIEFAAGVLDPARLEALDLHLDVCPDCRALMQLAGSQDDDAMASSPAVAHGVRPLSAGDSIGRYDIVDQLGAGAMGVVYEAIDPVLRRRVAIKVLHRTSVHGRAEARLVREARAMACLSHPNVVQVYDAGQADGRVFIAMELVEGTTLRRWLRERARSAREIAAMFAAAARGLAAAHSRGIVHRDFKPDNVLVGRDGRPRVVDFGLALYRDEASHLHDVATISASRSGPPLRATRTGWAIGTPLYMSPEQFVGRSVTAASDQFSLCVALYEALFGRRPFAGDSLEALAESVTTGRPKIPRRRDVPAGLRHVIARGLAVDPSARFASATALADALDERARRRLPAIALTGTVVVCAGVVLGSNPSPACETVDGMVVAAGSASALVARPACDTTSTATTKATTATIDRHDTTAEPLGRIVDEAKLLLDAGRGEQAERLLREHRAAFEAASDPRLRARERLVRGFALESLGQSDPAMEAFVSAYELGLTADHPETTARAAMHAALRIVRTRGDLDEARTWLFRAELATHRVGDPTLEGRYKRVNAELRRAEGDERGAHAMVLDAIATLESAPRPDTVERGRAFTQLGGLSQVLDEFERAEDEFGRARDLLQQALGKRHPILIPAYQGLGLTARARGDLATARQLLELCVSIETETQGPHGPNMPELAYQRGAIEIESGNYDAALTALEHALDLHEAHGRHVESVNVLAAIAVVQTRKGKLHDARATLHRAIRIEHERGQRGRTSEATLLHNLGEVERQLERFDDAREHYLASLRLWSEAYGEDSLLLASPLSGLGELELAQGEPARARVWLERASRLHAPGRGAPKQVGITRFALARALWADPEGDAEDRDRARVLAGEAVEAFATGALESERRAAQAWIADHQPTGG